MVSRLSQVIGPITALMAFLPPAATQPSVLPHWNIPRAVLKTSGEVCFLVISPDGKMVITTSGGKQDAYEKVVEDTHVELWELESGRKRDSLTFKERVVAATLAPDGKAVAVALWKQKENVYPVEVWDLTSRNRRAALAEHGSPVSLLSFRSDGKELISADYEFRQPGFSPGPGGQLKSRVGRGKVRVWDLTTGKEKSGWWDRVPPVAAVAVSPAGELLAVACIRIAGQSFTETTKSEKPSDELAVDVWRAGVEKPLELKHLYRNLINLQFSPDGKRLVCIPHPQAQEGGADFWDATTGKLLSRRENSNFQAALFSADGRCLIWSDLWEQPGKKVSLIDIATGKTVGHLRTSESAGFLAMAPDGRTLATATGSTVRLWGSAGALAGNTQAPLARLEGHSKPVTAVAFQPDGKKVVAISQQDALIWDTASGKKVSHFENQDDPAAPRDNPLFAGLAPDGSSLVSVLGIQKDKGLEFRVALRDSASGKQLIRLVGDVGWHPGMLPLGPHGGGPEWCPFAQVSADGRMIVTVSLRDLIASPESKEPDSPLFRVKLWDAKTGKLKTELSLAEKGGQVVGEPPLLALSGDGKTMLTSVTRLHRPLVPFTKKMRNEQPVEQGELRLWDAEGKLVAVFHRGMAKPAALALSADGKLVALAAEETVTLFDTAEKKEQMLKGHTGKVLTLVFSPDGKMLVSGDEQGVVRLWDVASGAAGPTLAGHGGAVLCAAFSGDGQRLATGSGDTTVLLWDVRRPQVPKKE